ncbi:MAG: hypothetical protein IT521_15350 [Burkholderiales bacterium]|nr:hypothetical protein [Burkholderiales bacterium]
MELDALFPPRAATISSLPGTRRPFPAADILRTMTHEAIIVLIVAVRIDRAEALEPGERERLALAVRRIQSAADIALPERDRRREFRQAAAIAERDLADWNAA